MVDTGMRDEEAEKLRHGSMKEDREENFEWIVTQNLTDYSGLWIAIVDKRIVSKGNDALEVVEIARRMHPKKVPFVFKVPSSETITM
jgi:hypothetical protein